tara:strand:+ start:258 stop:473 length:216 start_codon:yes stop_codon:yes gene_type:complete
MWHTCREATWPSGKAGACKALIPGSIPGVASNFFIFGRACRGGEIGIRDGLKSAPQILVIAVAREVWQQFK